MGSAGTYGITIKNSDGNHCSAGVAHSSTCLVNGTGWAVVQSWIFAAITSAAPHMVIFFEI